MRLKSCQSQLMCHQEEFCVPFVSIKIYSFQLSFMDHIIGLFSPPIKDNLFLAVFRREASQLNIETELWT
jgi:hypothetical protein